MNNFCRENISRETRHYDLHVCRYVHEISFSDHGAITQPEFVVIKFCINEFCINFGAKCNNSKYNN